MKRILVGILVVILMCFTAQAQYVDVILDNVDDFSCGAIVEKRVGTILQALEDGEIKSDIEGVTPEALRTAKDMISKVDFSNARPVHRTRLLRLPKGGYEVRDLKMRVDMEGTDGSPFQNLVMTITDDGRIDDIRFGMELHHYRRLVEEGEVLQDFARRQQILQFVEIFRTAYNRKDISYLQNIFSDDALIIVGRIVEPEPNLPDMSRMMEASGFSRKKIELVRKSKQEYLSALTTTFQRNAFVRVEFDSLEIKPHKLYDHVYGVALKQSWHSSTYSDTGYVFLMIDFKDEDHPLIHVRSWQPERFEDGSVINLYDFVYVGD